MGKDISHMPAASLGHYASLSFVVIGKRLNWIFETVQYCFIQMNQIVRVP